MENQRGLKDPQNQIREEMIQIKLEARRFRTPAQIDEFRSGLGMDSISGQWTLIGRFQGICIQERDEFILSSGKKRFLI